MTAAPWVWSGRRKIRIPVACDFLPPPEVGPSLDPAPATREALARPLASARLADIARETLASTTAKDDEPRVAIVVPDASRALPLPEILDAVLDELGAGGVADAQIAVHVGCGLHRSPPPDERARLVGERIAARVPVVCSQGIDSPQASLGTTALGCPVRIAEGVAGAHLIVTVGVVEPHLYAGFSGGVKGVAIGCAGQKTITWTHYPAFISRTGVELASLHDNPFQDTLREIAALTALRFAVNCVMDHGGGLAAVLAGGPVAVQEELAARFRPVWLHQVDGPYDAIVAGIAAPKDANLYQASRAATYLGLAARPALRDGGLIILAAGLDDGIGVGPGEANFGRVLTDAAQAADVVRRGLREPLGPGGQRAFVLARVLERYRLAILAPERPDAFRRFAHLGISVASSVTQALAALEPGDGPPRVLAVADAMATLVHA